MPRENLPFWCYLLATGFIAGGATSIGFAWRTRRLAEQSKSWPSVTGNILSCSIRTSETNSDPGLSTTLYAPEVEYEYPVEGATLRGNRIQFGGVSKQTELNKAQAMADQYPVGSQVKVFFNPANPSQCTLDQTVSFTGIVVWFVIGLLLLICGTMIFFAPFHVGNESSVSLTRMMHTQRLHIGNA